MKLSRLAVALMLSCLSGCAASEDVLFAIIPAQMPVLPVLGLAPAPTPPQPERSASTRTTKPPKPQPVSAGMPEPVLPPWIIPAPKPSSVLRYSLIPSELFRRLSPSVYAVVIAGAPQGSAVAVSSKTAVTNCHVVAHAKAILLVNSGASLRAEVIAADRKTDRCYLGVPDGELQSIPGVRDYATLAIGETVFTIGSPKGLVNTLGQGILSGLRRSEDDTEYVQITAPVSPGSSGGGLFDDRGNLIGVTTFTIRDSQNLNFAIAASQFWR